MQTSSVSERRLAWAAKLESGEYAQGTGELRVSDTNFCCLGVACDLYDNTKWSQSDTLVWDYEDKVASPPKGVVEFYAFTAEEISHFAILNDDEQFTFAQIAERVRKGVDSMNAQ